MLYIHISYTKSLENKYNVPMILFDAKKQHKKEAIVVDRFLVLIWF